MLKLVVKHTKIFKSILFFHIILIVFYLNLYKKTKIISIGSNQITNSIIITNTLDKLVNNLNFSLIITNKDLNTTTSNYLIIVNQIEKNESLLTNNSNLIKFTSNHESIVSTNNTGNKKIVFGGKNGAGYGNQLYGILTALTVAILTDSAFISLWDEPKNYISSPLKDIFKQYDSLSELSINFINSTYHSLGRETFNSWRYGKDLNFLLINTIPNFNRYFYDGISPNFFDICSNPIYFEKLLYYNLVKQETVIRANESLLNKNISDTIKVENLLLIGFEVAQSLLNYFWKPNDELQNKINEFHMNNFKSNFVIGIQIRTEFIDVDKDLDIFIKCGLYIEKNINKNNMNVKWYISSDSTIIFDKLKMNQNLANKLIQGEGKIGHVYFQSDTYYRTIFDNELLSKSDEIIITGGSTFGFIASVKNGKLPYYVEGKRPTQVIDENQPCKPMSLNFGPRRPEGYNLI